MLAKDTRILSPGRKSPRSPILRKLRTDYEGQLYEHGQVQNLLSAAGIERDGTMYGLKHCNIAFLFFFLCLCTQKALVRYRATTRLQSTPFRDRATLEVNGTHLDVQRAAHSQFDLCVFEGLCQDVKILVVMLDRPDRSRRNCVFEVLL